MADVKGKMSPSDDRRFAQMGAETVNLISETVGIHQLDPRVASALAEDASYRQRELAHVCIKIYSVYSLSYHTPVKTSIL